MKGVVFSYLIGNVGNVNRNVYEKTDYVHFCDDCIL